MVIGLQIGKLKIPKSPACLGLKTTWLSEFNQAIIWLNSAIINDYQINSLYTVIFPNTCFYNIQLSYKNPLFLKKNQRVSANKVFSGIHSS